MGCGSGLCGKQLKKIFKKSRLVGVDISSQMLISAKEKNVYDKNGDLISMGSESFNSNNFTGYDTFAIAVFHDTIHANAAKAKIYLTK